MSAGPTTCNICGHATFVLGPNGRKTVNGKLPQCYNCHSLERHRIIRAVYDRLREPSWRNLKVLQFSEDRSVDPGWFGSFEQSIFGGQTLSICKIFLAQTNHMTSSYVTMYLSTFPTTGARSLRWRVS